MKLVRILILIFVALTIRAADQDVRMICVDGCNGGRQAPELTQAIKQDLERDTVGTIEKLCKKHPDYVNAFHGMTQEGQCTIVMYVAGKLAHVEGTKMLLDRGADPDAGVPYSIPEFHPVHVWSPIGFVFAKAHGIKMAIGKLLNKPVAELKLFPITEAVGSGNSLSLSQEEVYDGLNKIIADNLEKNARELRLRMPENMLPVPLIKLICAYDGQQHGAGRADYENIEKGLNYLEIYHMLKDEQAVKRKQELMLNW